ncbi:MAG: MBL fold metallo-hydrolase [Gemmatimonadaceae bacterium]|nr:MBL fold metallo-hydrolase [Gemmatimonadaceae bacterium]
MIEVRPEGLYVPAADLWLDAREAPGPVFVSHAHGDHLTRSPAVLCTAETAAIAARRGQTPTTLITPAWDEPVSRHDAVVHLRPAGHTLGSAMLVVSSREGTLCYTGDFKRRPNPFSPPVRVPACDVLITECTFGDPRYRFPPDDLIVAALLAFVRDALAEDAVPVVCAYPFGKGQEALWHLLSAGLDVVLHGAIAELTDAHLALGATLPSTGRWRRYVRGALETAVLLTTPGSRKSPMVTALPRRRVCLLTGWALHPGAANIYRDCDLVLPLSDHADFDGLLETVRESGARTIYTVHGTPTFAAHLRAMGIHATHLAAHPQTRTDAVQLALEL